MKFPLKGHVHRNIKEPANKAIASDIFAFPYQPVDFPKTSAASSGGSVQAQGGAPAPPVAGNNHYRRWSCTSASDLRCTQRAR
ncbi:unnamed protein product [Prunus armeniaca]